MKANKRVKTKVRTGKRSAGSLHGVVMPLESLCRHLHTISSVAYIEAGGPRTNMNETWEQCPPCVKAAYRAIAKYVKRHNSKVSYHADSAGGAHGKDSNDK